MRNIIFVLIFLAIPINSYSEETKAPVVEGQAKKKVRYKKTQELSFDSENVDGVARNPYGAYLSQQRGVDFAPLYKVRERFDENIKDSVHYMRSAK